MSWIKTVSYDQAEGRLKRLYEQVKGPEGTIDNILSAHSLRPHTLAGHLGLYKAVLHHTGNRLPKWLLEAVGLYVSLLNRCHYCVEHHAVGMARQLGDAGRAVEIGAALEALAPERALTGRELALMRYAGRLTQTPAEVDQGDIEILRAAGLDDGEILEANQVVSYFAYANRTVLGLGVSLSGDVLGLSPSSDATDDWSHR